MTTGKTRHAFGVGVLGWPLLVLLVLSPLPASATLIFVKAEATGAGDGTSWADAFPSLRTGLSVAQFGDEVWVAAGTYRPAKASRTTGFPIKPGVILRGGFAGSETALGERDLAAAGRETILSGDLNGDDGPDFANYGENSYHVLQSTSVGFESTPGIIEGFVITGGNADSSTMTMHRLGGGITVRAGGVICRNCLFLNNKAESGGALSVRPNLIASHVELIDCTLLANAASGEGGAVSSPAGTLILTRCRLLGNSARGSGGGLANAGDAVLSNCLFSGNTARLGAGAANLSSGMLTIRSSTLSGNAAEELGGGLYHAGDGASVVTSSILWGNTSSCGATATQIDSDKDPVPIVRYSCVQGGWTAASGEANIDADPAFLDGDGADDRLGTVDDNPRLWGYSPAIDAGDDAVPEEALDLDSNPRHFDAVATADTGKGVAPVIDMGAFEYQGDCNGNGQPDAQDIARGGSKDSDQDGIPDECVAPPLRNLDCNSNGVIDSEDLWPSLVFTASQSLDFASRP
ncbi:MAG TPA: right-handed parallel beta-helix repeat-containing protein, partial [Planctomycetota bacterium]|nr:right-handed parallel beta-helix repeat-containing protein [Planctomycetota bacterium]